MSKSKFQKNRFGSLGSTLSVSACLTMTVLAPAQAETTLIVATEDSSLMQRVADVFSDYDAPLELNMMHDVGVIKAIGESTGDVVILQRLASPDTEIMNETLQVLGQRSERATYMVFVDQADDYKWTEDLEKPNNVKIATTIHSQDKLAVAEIYEAVGLDYDGSNLKYDYTNATEMAIMQLASDGNNSARLALKPWEPGVSAMFFDGGILRSGAPNDTAAEFVDHFLSEHESDKIPAGNAFGVKQWRELSDQTMTEWDAIIAELALTECVGSERWDGMSDVQVLFQSFGIHNGR